MAYLLLITGLTISAVAIYYSVVGLAAIFSAAVIPIVVMGSSLEIAKLVCASWLKANWERAPRFMKYYMITAVIVLMLITSMGIFGFLSKAHNDQNLVSGDVQSKIAIYDEKIKTAKDNIDANRKALKQMDEAVDQVMGRSQDEKGADKAVAIRRGQAKERTRLLSEITAEQKTIAQLSEERAPIAAEVRKVEAEVGPIKYIAKFIYGETGADENMLEKAVTWIIILIVVVFDPLAVIMLLAAQMTFGWLKPKEQEAEPTELAEPTPEEDAVTKEYVDDQRAEDPPIPSFLLKKDAPLTDVDHEEADNDTIIIDSPNHAYLTKPWVWKVPGVDPVPPQVYHPDEMDEPAKPVEDPKEIEILSRSHLNVDGKRVSFDELYDGDPDVKDAVELAGKLEKTGEYVITHTPESILVADEDGKTIEVPYTPEMDERPGDYVTPTYVQNEEQQQGGLWQKIKNSISEEEYIQKSEQNKKGDA